jgi:uncharacterized membrane protein (UPF0127 family)
LTPSDRYAILLFAPISLTLYRASAGLRRTILKGRRANVSMRSILPLPRDSRRLWAAAGIVLACLTLLGGGRAAAQNLDKLEIVTSTGVHAFSVEMATNDAERERGLMYRRFMPADRGMLFDFKREEPVMFWMKNTYIPLDMIFISRAGIVVSIAADAEPLSERTIPSGGPCYGVLELNGGVAARIALKPGDKVLHPIFAP